MHRLASSASQWPEHEGPDEAAVICAYPLPTHIPSLPEPYLPLFSFSCARSALHTPAVCVPAHSAVVPVPVQPCPSWCTNAAMSMICSAAPEGLSRPPRRTNAVDHRPPAFPRRGKQTIPTGRLGRDTRRTVGTATKNPKHPSLPSPVPCAFERSDCCCGATASEENAQSVRRAWSCCLPCSSSSCSC